MSSPVFETMLELPAGEDDTLLLPDDSPYAIEWIINHLYHNTIDLPGVAGACQVYLLADKYQLEALSLICAKYLEENVSCNTFTRVFNVATLLNNVELVKASTPMLAMWSDEVLSCPELGMMSTLAFRRLIDHTSLGPSSEVVFFKAIWNWARTRPVREKNSVRMEMIQFLVSVRFLRMTEEEFMHNVVPTGVLHCHEIDAILQVIRGVKDITLPLLAPCRLTEERQRLVRRAVLERPIDENTHTPHARRIIKEQTMIKDLTVSSTVYVGQFICTGIMDLNVSMLIVLTSKEAVIARGKWKGTGCKFDKPIRLQPDEKYILKLKSETGLSAWDEAGAGSACGGFTEASFSGCLYCPRLIIDFIRA
ncbi:uncharacterized protein [Procambarus clarkii]|uniref:uncharacterized protein isoform X2 n=1 Tax=Procambarus clarkii TaxID=6728 RepID=UPI0037442C34